MYKRQEFGTLDILMEGHVSLGVLRKEDIRAQFVDIDAFVGRGFGRPFGVEDQVGLAVARKVVLARACLLYTSAPDGFRG